MNMDGLIIADDLLPPERDLMTDGMCLCLCKDPDNESTYWKVVEIFSGKFMMDDDESDIVGFIKLDDPESALQEFTEQQTATTK